MQSGELTVTGKDTTRILLLGFPRRVEVHFADVDPVPCNPHHRHDQLHYEVIRVDEDHRHHRPEEHHHHGPQFYLVISWNVESVREIIWHVDY